MFLLFFFYPCWWRQKDHTGQHGTHIWLVVSKYILILSYFQYTYIYIYCIYFQPWKWEDDSNLLTISYIYIVYSMYIHSIYTYIYIYYIILSWLVVTGTWLLWLSTSEFHPLQVVRRRTEPSLLSAKPMGISHGESKKPAIYGWFTLW